MAGELATLVVMVCDSLDTSAGAFWNSAELKDLHRKFKEVHYHFQSARRWRSDQNMILNSLLTGLEGLPSDVDELIDTWLRSKSKFDRLWRRIGGQLVPLLNLLHNVVSDYDDEETSEILQEISSRSDVPAVVEGVFERSISTVKDLLIVKKVRVVLVKGASGSEKTALARTIFTDVDVKAEFPSPFWFSVGKNFDLSSVVKAIEFKCSEILSAQRTRERLLIVLDDVSDLNDEKLEGFILLVSNLSDLAPSVLVTTRSDSVANVMRKIPAQQLLAYFPESNSWFDVNSEEVVRLVSPEVAVIIQLQSNLDEIAAMDVDAALGSENLKEEEMICPPTAATQRMHESEVQLEFPTEEGLGAQVPASIVTIADVPIASREAIEGGLVAQMPASIVTNSDVPIHEMELEAGPSQKKKKVM